MTRLPNKRGKKVEPIRAWAVMYEDKYFNVYINAPAQIYATRRSAYEYANGSKVIPIEIRPIPKRRRRK